MTWLSPIFKTPTCNEVESWSYRKREQIARLFFTFCIYQWGRCLKIMYGREKNLDEIKKWRERIQTIYVDYDFYVFIVAWREPTSISHFIVLMCWLCAVCILFAIAVTSIQFFLMMFKESSEQRKRKKIECVHCFSIQHFSQLKMKENNSWCFGFAFFPFNFSFSFLVEAKKVKTRIQCTFHIIYKHKAGILLWGSNQPNRESLTTVLNIFFFFFTRILFQYSLICLRFNTIQ